MKGIKLITRSLRFYKKQHLAVLIGTIISTAVLTGAFITGDSVKYSLKQLVENRLGKAEYILQSGDRFIRSELAKEISDDLKLEATSLTILNGISTNPENEKRINKTQILAVADDFWHFANKKPTLLNEEEAIISENVAERLNVKLGDEIVLRVENLDVIPINSPFSDEEAPAVAFRLKIKEIANKDNLGLFNLKSNQVSPYNIYVSQEFLNKKLDLEGLSNLILIANNKSKSIDTEILNNAFEKHWQLRDAGIKLKRYTKTGKYEISSKRIFIDKQISKAYLQKNTKAERIISYLVNSINCRDRNTPYSFITALNSSEYINLSKNDIVINQWLANDLNANIGDTINLDYFIINPLHNLKEKTDKFIVKYIIQNKDSIVDRTLMPKFPGFDNAITCMDWNTNVPIDLDKIRDKDDDYWNTYRGTPKALVSIDKGLEMWENNFGNYTAIRFTSDKEKEQIEKEILASFHPSDLNLMFVSVKQEGIRSASSGVDFGELFLSMSFFVILSALLLVILLYSINIQARNKELGILLSLGFRRRTIVNNIVYEHTLVFVIGGIIGVFVGILYNMGLMTAINSVWNDIVRTKTISIDINILSLAKGALAGIEISAISIYFITLFKLKRTPVGIINNTTQSNIKTKKSKIGIMLIVFLFCIIASVAMVFYSVSTSIVNNSSMFLIAGALFLVGTYALFNLYIKHKIKAKRSQKLNLNSMAIKNIGRNLNRSMAIVILLSLGTFIVLITGANRRTFNASEDQYQSGTGGYSYWAETSLPVLNDLNTEYGKSTIGLENNSELDSISFFQMYSLSGDDASCLNLNQVKNPTILGVNANILHKRKSFSFAKLLATADKENAWLELNKTFSNNIIPAYADQTVIQWGIMKKVGDTIQYHNEKGEEINLVLIGGLNASIFQGNILISEANFLKHFPSLGGSKTMLIDCPKEKQTKVYEILNSDLKDYGIEISNTSHKLSQFYSVTNTYLSVFMILGGLGVIIATIGLGIIIYRNLLDRKQEIALLMVTGYTKQLIVKLIFKENIILIFVGTLIGILSAVIAILPSILTTSFNIPQAFVFVLILIILTNSIIWAYYPIRKAMKRNIISSLRME